MNFTFDVRVLQNVVVGSGAAAYNAANRLHDLGEEVTMVAENRLAGTSRNTGSDKQTYYKLTLSGDYGDSVEQMAGTLFDGKAVDGDLCMAEAANSVRSFMNLVELGVPFPTDKYGSFVGYKTDHDPALRGTSVGPLTSKAMTEKLEEAAQRRGIELIDKQIVIKILVENGRACGVLTLDQGAGQPDDKPIFHVLLASNIVYATGGPAGIYKNVVYPHGHYGMSGIAYEAGVKGRNLTEWQYGLASVKPRWNVSGTYMQVLPRFVSTAQDGSDSREFLQEALPGLADELNLIFLKGYQWPFDVKKAQTGSSLIDLLVYKETALRKRRVFLDFRQNPRQTEVPFDSLSTEANTYLTSVGACFGTPLDRLRHMNEPAYEFYLGRGVDLAQEMLEIDLCAQHNNGGLAVNNWWQTDIQGLYAAGEVAGTHGVNRPGGSALNAGQVGSLRAALHIHSQGNKLQPELTATLREQVEEQVTLAKAALSNSPTTSDFAPETTDVATNPGDDSFSSIDQLRDAITSRFSEIAGPIRDVNKLKAHQENLVDLLANFSTRVQVTESKDMKKVFRLRDILVAQLQYTAAMLDYAASGGKSRGSAIFLDATGETAQPEIFTELRYSLDDSTKDELIQEVAYHVAGDGMHADGTHADGVSTDSAAGDFTPQVEITWRKRHPLPVSRDAFETTWRTFREDGNIH